MTDPDPDQMKECIAFHELGHAVVMREIGLTPGELRVYNAWFSGSVRGYCTIKEDAFPIVDGKGDWGSYKGYLIGTVAGQMAVDRWCELRNVPRRFTAESDYAEFAIDSACVPGGFSLEEAEATARVHVSSHWSEIERLAPVLAERGRIAASRIG
jgi:hypothetical protein